MSKARDLSALLSADGKVEADDLDVGQIGGRRNLLINGDFQVSQRGDYTTAVTTNHTTYYVDRWVANSSVANTIQHISSNQPTAINGKSIKHTATASGTGIVGSIQHIEDFAKLSNKTVTVSAWVKSNTTTAGISIKHDDTWQGDTSNFHSGSGNWEHLSQTFVINEALTARFLVFIALQGANAASASISSGDYIEITGVQLEEGSVATPFEHRSYGEELALCQRYYADVKGNWAHPIATGLSYRVWQHQLPVTMRASPTIKGYTYGGTGTETPDSVTATEQQGYAQWNSVGTGAFVAINTLQLEAEL